MFHAVEAGELATVALHGPDSATAKSDERIYREHNVTHHHRVGLSGGGHADAAPNAPTDQCQCGNCGSHRKRAGITATAEPGKDR